MKPQTGLLVLGIVVLGWGVLLAAQVPLRHLFIAWVSLIPLLMGFAAIMIGLKPDWPGKDE